MSALGLHQLILPPSGVEYATALKLTPSTVTPSSASTSSAPVSGCALYNVVLARSNYLRVYEVREEPVQVDGEKEREREKKYVRKGTEAVEGEVEMDEGGEGFVNVGSVKVILLRQCPSSYTCNIMGFTPPLHRILVEIQALQACPSPTVYADCRIRHSQLRLQAPQHRPSSIL